LKLFTFTGDSPAQALKYAQEACSKNALVISTKQISKKSRDKDAVYEVIVAAENSNILPPPTKKERETPKKEQEQERPISKKLLSDEVILDISNQAKILSEKRQQEELNSKKEEDIKSNSQKDHYMEDIQHDIHTLNEQISLLQTMLWKEMKPTRSNFIIPPEFAEIYKLAKQSGMDEEDLNQIMQSTITYMPAQMKDQPAKIKKYFQVLLKKMIKIKQEETFSKKNQKIVMFVGPTGVGKTTSLAKLAARFSFLEHKYKVGIITLDTYRIGALEQLFQYAKTMKLPIEDVLDSSDFKKALDTFSYCDLILIDTAGSSQFDQKRILKISKLIEKSEKQISVKLVLSASTKLEDLQQIYKKFSFLHIDSLIITKFDETNSFGNIFSLSFQTEKSLSYFSYGQEVPNDIMPASKEFLVECILNGYKRSEN